MNDEYDRGKIINQKYFKISKLDTVKTVYDNIAILSYLTIKEKLSLAVGENLIILNLMRKSNLL